MLTVTYGQLREPVFGRALQKLANCSGLKSIVTTFNVAKIFKQVLEETKTCEECYHKLVQEFAEKEEDGTTIKVPEGQRPGAEEA
jgi:hypothetical protein